ncbi:MAG: flagellar hook-basal body complex protein FliE [Planctomycetota bacterium]|nr:MAG: flagellar hook-basal body complex protein FliE [Planctomycetota bacterium]
MSDPIGLVGASGSGPIKPRPNVHSTPHQQGPNFKEALLKSLEEVNAAQQDADRAVEDLVTGKRQDVEGVVLATEKADMAFQMLQSVRNKVMGAYEEIKQIRV